MVEKRQPKEFEWDRGNQDKSYKKHGISPNECEEIFLDERLLVIPDLRHGEKEERFIAIGKTSSAKVLFCVFTMRGEKIRVISARMANKKERVLYETKEIKENPDI